MSALTVDNRNYDDMIHYYEARIEALERRLKLVEQRTADSAIRRWSDRPPAGSPGSRQSQTEDKHTTAPST